MLTLRRMLIGIAVVVVIFAATTGRYFFYPDVGWLRDHNPKTTSFIGFREAQWRHQNRPRKISIAWVPYNRISPHLIKAVVVSEDAKFWQHNGFDLAAMRYAAQENIGAKRFKFGASTISQQLVKNLYLKPSKNFFRKAAEAVLTWRLERTLTKKRILEIYLNVIEWGDGIFGVERAARHYFGKSASELTASESARLAVVLPSPRKLDPLSGGHYVERRADIILKRMFPEAAPEAPGVAELPLPESDGTVAAGSADTIAKPATSDSALSGTGSVDSLKSDTLPPFVE